MNKPRKGNKNYRNKSKFDKFSKEERSMDKGLPKCNDPSWYIREGQLAKDVASFSFNTALGNAVEINVDDPASSGLTGKRVAVPGIMRIHTVPSVGYSPDGSSPVNLAAKNLYSWVRHANSGHSNYDSPDLMLYMVAMDSIYALIWHLQRAYGTARVYSQKNRFIGDALLRAMGFIPNEVRENLADFRSYINMLIVKASAFCTPINMTLFKRHTWMYSSVFKDEDVEKSQMYLYVPDFLYMYNENAGAGKCDPIAVVARDVFPSGYIEYRNNFLATWYSIGNTLINALVASEDINIMSGDIRKAYGENGIWKIGLIPEDYACIPIFSDEILDQIHNTVFTGRYPISGDPNDQTTWTTDVNSFTVYQDVLDPLEPIKCTPTFKYGFEMCVEHFCDMAENEPSPERILVATRNMISGKLYNPASGYFFSEVTSFASDLCLYADVYSFSSGGTEQIDIMYGDQFSYLDAEKFTKFHKAPLSYKFKINSSNTYSLEEVLGELGDFIVMDKKDIDKMHQSALLSMMGVPV